MICKYGNEVTTNWEEEEIDANKVVEENLEDDVFSQKDIDDYFEEQERKYQEEI